MAGYGYINGQGTSRSDRTRAASGRRTTRLRSPVATPRASGAADGRVPRCRWLGTATSMAKGPLDLGHDAGVGIEEAAVHLRPAAQPPLLRADGEKARRLHEVVVPGHALAHGPVALIGECLLGRGRPEVLVERPRRRLPA